MKVVANIGINWWDHDKSEDRAHTLIDEALRVGVTAICIPYFQADVFRDEDKQDQVRKFEIGQDLLESLLNQVSAKRGVDVYVSPRYPEGIAYLERINVSGYHVQNGDILYKPLLETLQGVDKPILLSTGLATMAEVSNAIDTILGDKVPEDSELVLLHSTGGLPTSTEDSNIRRILDLAQEFFPLYVGIESFLSMQFLDYVALAYNPAVIMRRLDLEDRKGVETAYSLTPEQMGALVAMSNAMQSILYPDVDAEGLTLTEFEARKKILRCEESDWVIPPSE